MTAEARTDAGAPAGWYPVALGDDIEPATSAGTRLFGHEIVVWRDDGGLVHVWEDRCPHRGMRLSFGFVRGTHIACLYHGWQFDAGGRCRHIPAHPALAVPASITVERLAVAERCGIVWAFSGAAAEAGAPPADNGAARPVRSLAIEAPADAVFDALASVPSPFGASPPEHRRDGPLVRLSAGTQTLYAAVQALAPAASMVHLALDPAAAAAGPQVSLWAEALRRTLEAAAAEMAEPPR